MNKAEFIKTVEAAEINKDRKEAIEEVYGTKINNEVAKLVSYADKVDFFDEERRALTYKEILNPKKNMQIDFVGLGYIPVVDAYDNSYVVYVIAEKKWAKYHAIDKVLFKKKDTFKEVL